MLRISKATNNEICKLLGIKFPIFHGSMAYVSDADLAGSVSKNGGLGVISCAGLSAEALRKEIKKARTITTNPIGVNLFLTMPGIEELIDICIEEKVDVITTGAGSPEVHIKKIKAAEIKIFPVIASVEHALKMEELGVDGIIAEGSESGGHIGSLSTMTLVPQVVNAVKIPVIAAGGIASGKQALAAFALGAKAIQCGTIFLVANECNVHENYKQKIINSKGTATVSVGNFTRRPFRIIDNKFAEDMLEMEKQGDNPDDVLKKSVGKFKLAAFEGDIENGSVMAGEVVSMINEEKSTKDIIDGLMAELKEEYKNIT